jgi:membrane dipeptidase
MQIDWPALRTGRADLFDGAEVEISGWIAPIEVSEHHDYFLLVEEPMCCLGCLPSNPSACVEVFAARAISSTGHSVGLAGQWRGLIDDPAGWRYQLREARLVDTRPAPPAIRRTLLSAGALAALAACAPQEGAAPMRSAVPSATPRRGGSSLAP